MPTRIPEHDEPTSVAVTPPTINPADWEDHQGFRETFLAHFPAARENQAFRVLAELLYTLILESPLVQPAPPEGHIRHQVRAAVADLRFLQGYLASLESMQSLSSTVEEKHLCLFAAAQAAAIAQVADEIETQLGP